MRLASDARRFDVSPAWLSWHAAAATLELFEAVGLGRIHEHNLALANRLRKGLGLEPRDSAIVSLDAADEATERLAGAGVRPRSGRTAYGSAATSTTMKKTSTAHSKFSPTLSTRAGHPRHAPG